MYGDEAFAYLDRHQTFTRADYATVDIWQPSFLLVCDFVTPQIGRAAARTNFEVLQCGTYRSRRNRYALGLSGHRPRARPRILAAGIDVALKEAEGVTLLIPTDRRTLPAANPTAVLAGDRELSLRKTSDDAAYVVPVDPAELQELVGEASRYRLTFDSRLIPADPT